MTMPRITHYVSRITHHGSRVSAALSLVLLPWRAHLPLVERRLDGVYNGYTDFVFYWSDVALVVTLALWVLGRAIAHKRICRGPLWLSLPLAALTVWSFVTAPFSIDPTLSLYHSLRLILKRILAVSQCPRGC